MSEFDPTDIRGQERSKAESELRNKAAKDTEESDFKWLMGSKRGRRIVWRLLAQAGTFQLSFSTNAMQMAFAEGNRNYGNRVLTMIHTLCPELYAVMMREQLNDNRIDADGSRNHN
jgi:hypothetical protein